MLFKFILVPVYLCTHKINGKICICFITATKMFTPTHHLADGFGNVSVKRGIFIRYYAVAIYINQTYDMLILYSIKLFLFYLYRNIKILINISLGSVINSFHC